MTSPVFPPGGTYEAPVPRVDADAVPAAATPYERLPRALRWDWWRPLVAVGVIGAGVLIASVVVIAGAMVVATLSGDDVWSETGYLDFLDRLLRLDATDPLAIITGLASIALWIPFVLLGLRLAGMRPVGHLFSVRLRMRWRWLALCLLPALATLVVSLGAGLALSAVTGTALVPEWTPMSRLLPALLVVILLVPFQAAAEELVFRGVAVQALGSWLPPRWWGRAIVVLVPTVAFVFSHAYDVWGQLDVGAFALAAMWVTLRTGGLEAAIALHVVNNVMVFALLATGALGTTVNGEGGGSLTGLLITAVTSIGYCAVVEGMARRRGIAATSTWPERSAARPLAVPAPAPFAPVLGRVPAHTRLSP